MKDTVRIFPGAIIEIREYEESKYHVFVEGRYFRACFGYNDLAQTIGSLVKSKFKKDLTNFA